MPLSLYNTLTRKKEAFAPLEAGHVKMYVCGPTVYDRPHLGNARSVVVYDVLFRLLSQLYPKVTYVRNITDVDDKINAQAKANGEPISALTSRVEGWFHDDMAALNCLPPTKEPHATQHIAQMIAIIEQLIARGHAYVSQGHVLFAVESYKEYGRLSGRKLSELVAGARVEVESYKKHPGDFVLWKPADAGDDASSVFQSPWGAGRPGWHIECSAMSGAYLGDAFDIHGGGADLMFPHHENEIAQSACAKDDVGFAKFWVHNGFLTVGGEKMSKSLGNFTTVKDVLDKGVKGEVIRLALLTAKYSEPLDWNPKLVEDAKKTLDKWYRILEKVPETPVNPSSLFMDALKDDLNIPKAFAIMHEAKTPAELKAMGGLLGLLQQDPSRWSKEKSTLPLSMLKDAAAGHLDSVQIQFQIEARAEAKKAKNWAEADRIRKELSEQGILLEDKPDGTTDWRRA
ncbi:MAG: cysteine--tRNA ligase [Rickettsiales bacterium]|nr:cysteine--tRNA ligase [Rickettsiales bacterium]